MILENKNICIKNNTKVTLRSPLISDSAEIIRHLKATSDETYFLLRYPQEIMISLEDEEKFINQRNSEAKSFMMVAQTDNRIVGIASLWQNSNILKIKHRASFAISIENDFCNLGLGSKMISEVINKAKDLGFEQIELGVFSDNLHAQYLYKIFGFIEIGLIPCAYKLSDGSYRDEIQMVLRF